MIWELDENLFKDEISLLFEQYLKTRTQLVASAEAPALLAALFSQAAPGSSLVATDPALQSFLGLPARARRRDPLVVQLADAVAGSRELLMRLLHFTRTLFLHSRNLTYCLLRADVLLSLHERNALPSELAADAAVGPALRLLLSLDGCVRELQAAAPMQQPATAPAHSQYSQPTVAHAAPIDSALLEELSDLWASIFPAEKESKRPRLADKQLQQMQQLCTYARAHCIVRYLYKYYSFHMHIMYSLLLSCLFFSDGIMTLCDPHVLFALFSSLLSILHSCLSSESLPKVVHKNKCILY